MRAVPAEAREDVPVVRGDDRQPGEERGLGEGVRGEAAPAPLVLHLVEDVLAAYGYFRFAPIRVAALAAEDWFSIRSIVSDLRLTEIDRVSRMRDGYFNGPFVNWGRCAARQR